MIFNRYFWFTIFFLLVPPQATEATCMTVDRDLNPGPFETFYFCNNTLAKPVYKIVRHYIGENFVEIFNFDPRGANIICNDYELDKLKMADCRKAGVRQIKKSYKSRNTIMETMRLSGPGKSSYKELYAVKGLFSYPRTPDEIPLEQCFVHMAEDHLITIGYDETNFMALSTCLIRFEGFLKSNKKLLLELIR